jgi:signal transduction histidine kinase
MRVALSPLCWTLPCLLIQWTDPSADDLRRRAEQRVVSARLEASRLNEDEARRTLHELQVHQIELQMQNEALQQSELEAQEALHRLAELNRTTEDRIVQRTAELVAARDAAESANRAKSAFLSNMSHELRTPMNGVMGFIELALLRATDAKQLDWLEKARSSAGHLLSIINDILDSSKMEAEQLRIERVEFRLNKLLEFVTDTLTPVVTKRGLSFDVEVAAKLANRPLLGDPQRLRQVLLNLAGNAVKFTDQGTVRIAVRIEVEDADKLMVRFEVQDSGIGIAPHDQERLFKAFGQVEDTMSRNYGGTGLGLSICKHIVQLMGGQIGVDSAFGAGSTFWFTVALGSARSENSAMAAVEASPSASAALASEFADARVLVAEDNPINQRLIHALLDDIGMQIDIASDGAAAVDMAIAGHYALILMDLQMPKLNGIDATRAIRQAPGCKRMPIIALTASVFDRDWQRCLDAGMDGYIAKPLAPESLYGTMLEWLRRQD